MEIAYTAHTETCTLLLDAEGICRSVLAASNAPSLRIGRPKRIPASAEKCIGAQYVATLDLRDPGGMAPACPSRGRRCSSRGSTRTGASRSFAAPRSSRFEAGAPEVAVESGVHARPA